jgi:hypothetical protein
MFLWIIQSKLNYWILNYPLWVTLFPRSVVIICWIGKGLLIWLRWFRPTIVGSWLKPLRFFWMKTRDEHRVWSKNYPTCGCYYVLGRHCEVDSYVFPKSLSLVFYLRLKMILNFRISTIKHVVEIIVNIFIRVFLPRRHLLRKVV